MMNRLLIATVFLAWTTFAQAEPLRVASLSTVMADLARDIGAERVEVTEIVKAGVDPHIYEPTPGDRKTIAKSQILLASGLGFEGYLDKLRPSLEKAGVRLVVGGDVVKPIEGACDEHEGHDHSHSHSHGSTDPHWWHSISNVQAVAAQICDAFVAADPAGKATYEANAKNLQTRLASLSKWVRLQLAALPKANRVLVTSHDALGYFAKDNGFEIFAVQGISTSDQPSSQKVKRLIGEIKDRKVKAIFAENIENPKVLEQITNETGAKPGGVLYADGLGSGAAGTYEGMMKSNVSTIVEALK
jgi:zinc/manganese transport system substrate-binding protein